MTLVEVTPENDYWNKQKVLYAYDTDRVATLFDESTENEKIYGYQFLNGDVQELIDDDINSWEDAERVFLPPLNSNLTHVSCVISFFNSILTQLNSIAD